MAAATYSITTAGTTLAKVWKKVQGGLLKGFQTSCEEYALAKRLKEFNLNFSAREVTTPIDISSQGGVAMIPEGGNEANPNTVAPQELTFSWTNFNARFTISKTAQYLDRKNRDAEIIRQMKYQGLKLMQGLTNRIGYSFYGYSTGYVCQTSTNATTASQTFTLINAFGESDIDNAAYLAAMFSVGDRIALIRSAALVTNGIGVITAITAATPSIAVTMNGSCDADANDYIVLANSLENTTIAGTDYGLAPPGLLDAINTVSIHGLSDSTYPNWAPALVDTTTGGRFSGVKLRKMKYAIQNRGGGELNQVIWSNGVETDVFASQTAAVRFADPLNMQLDGDTDIKSVKQFTSRKAPPSRVFGLDTSTLFSWCLRALPGEEGYNELLDDGDKIQDINAMVYSLDLPMTWVHTNRANYAYMSGLDEQ